jgi:predicted helicase
MPVFAIKNFLKELEDLKHYGGTTKETAIRFAFQKLLDEYARAKELRLVAEVSIKLKNGRTVTPDGTLKDVLRLDHGYWESKDESDDINEEIEKKFAKGYPSDNILFEDSQTAVLFQHGEEVMRTALEDEAALNKILNTFISYERQEVTDFRKAIEKFKEDIPEVTRAIRGIIDKQDSNPEFVKALATFHELCKQSINPEITTDDMKEMMVQHIITADIFNTIFDEPHFHQENNIARELNRVIETFFIGAARRETLGRIKHYYDTINAAAAGIADHHEKQKFLKVVYETFYKAYNPKAADRLGIVYTPNEIVQFMIKSTDSLLHKHFGKVLADKNVEILDPATGTGTFICDIIDYLPQKKAEYKYKNELHANELAILPYYIANLNIEYTYKQKTGNYAEFENLCFVDTLDNTGFHWVGKQGDLFGMSAENAVRIKKQNERKISVIIGNPPYNAKQENYNFQNANRGYKEIDKRIKDTFIKHGKAQNQIVVYDMYTRFYRWAMDRLDENGIIAMITNRSFIDGRAFDGFRKIAASEFNHIYIVDLGGDVRANPKLSGTKNNVFGIQTGVAIMFLVKKDNLYPAQTKKEYQELKRDFSIVEEPVIVYKNKKYYSVETTRIYYVRRPEFDTIEAKLAWLSHSKIESIEFDSITPDKNNNWINISDNNWDTLLPLMDKDAKSGKKEQAIFKLFSRGVATQRDEWVYDLSKEELKKKIKFFTEIYETTREDKNFINKNKIKWDRELGKYLERSIEKKFSIQHIIQSLYRPYSKQYFYFDKHFNGMTYQWFDLFRKEKENNYIVIPGLASPKNFFTLCSDTIVDLNCLPAGCQCLPLYRYDGANNQIENIADWGLQQFITHYKSKKIAKENIFHYVYAVLHHPAYRKKYELNLKREFPRIPFYDNFWQWAKWGEQLMKLHIEYENTVPYPLKRIEIILETTNPASHEKFAKAKLKANKTDGSIELDGYTTLTGIPKEAWEYKLGNRSALEWILDQYKEKKPSDPTIAEKFNTYRFANYKEQVIDLLMRVCTVSIETMKVIGEMEKIQ